MKRLPIKCSVIDRNTEDFGGRPEVDEQEEKRRASRKN